MLIDRRCRLSAAVAFVAAEIEGCDSVLAEGASERRAAIHRSPPLTGVFCPKVAHLLPQCPGRSKDYD
jgi:hypothetical protein